MTSPRELALLRLVAQRLAGPRAATATDAIRLLTAVQGQDLPGALVSVALRTAGGTRAAVGAALDAGDVVRSWPMRGTLHLVPRRLDREEALGELALRYFRGHGPATVKDLARWAGLRVSDVRAGLARAGPELTALDVEGTAHWMAPETPDRLAGCRAEAGRVLLLPGFDELVLGYADRSCTVPPAFADRIVPGGNGMFRATVVSGGEVAAVWRRAGRGAGATIAVEPFAELSPAVSEDVLRLFAALP